MLKRHVNVFDLEKMQSELSELEQKLQSPEVWSDQKLASELGQKSRAIKDELEQLEKWEESFENVSEIGRAHV